MTGFSITESKKIELKFSKNVIPDKSLFEITPSLGIISFENMEKSIIVLLSEEQTPGQEYFIKARIKDNNGNTLLIGAKFYGFNPEIPEILINEFTTNGSAAHPDMVELYIKTNGNMAGVVFYAGCDTLSDFEFVFPNTVVTKGEYIILHTKPQGIDDEKDETGENKNISGGLDASPYARDFWVKGGTGLSGNNGALSIYTSPGGNLMDAVIYSNRNSLSDEKYGGFGSSAMLQKINNIFEQGGWIFSTDKLIPEDCVNPEQSSATRSISRSSLSTDTDTSADWHITPTSGYSFGKINNDAVYQQ
jgi:hypothetical protein